MKQGMRASRATISVMTLVVKEHVQGKVVLHRVGPMPVELDLLAWAGGPCFAMAIRGFCAMGGLLVGPKVLEHPQLSVSFAGGRPCCSWSELQSFVSAGTAASRSNEFGLMKFFLNQAAVGIFLCTGCRAPILLGSQPVAGPSSTSNKLGLMNCLLQAGWAASSPLSSLRAPSKVFCYNFDRSHGRLRGFV